MRYAGGRGPRAVVCILGNRVVFHISGVGHLSVPMAETSPEISPQLELEIVTPVGGFPLTLCPSASLCVFPGKLNCFRLGAFPFSSGPVSVRLPLGTTERRPLPQPVKGTGEDIEACTALPLVGFGDYKGKS